MANNKTIHSAVRIDEDKDRGDGRMTHIAKTFSEGDEEELGKVASKETLKRLSEEGAISGYGYDKKEAASDEAASEAKTEA